MSEESRATTSALTRENTLLVTRRVRGGHGDDFRAWATRMIGLAERFPGNLGTTVLVPHDEDQVYRLVFRFADEATLAGFERSRERVDLSAEADAFSSASRSITTGLEAWFEGDVEDVPAPPKWKMALVTFAVVYVMTSVLIPLENALLPDVWPFLAVNVVTNLVIAGLMTWLVMPAAARVLRAWLYR